MEILGYFLNGVNVGLLIYLWFLHKEVCAIERRVEELRLRVGYTL